MGVSRVPRVPGVPRARRAGGRARRRLRPLRQAVPRRVPAPRHGDRAQVRMEVQGLTPSPHLFTSAITPGFILSTRFDTLSYIYSLQHKWDINL